MIGKAGLKAGLIGLAVMVLISLVLFTVFGSFFGAVSFLGKYWPVLLIALGVVSLFQALFKRDE